MRIGRVHSHAVAGAILALAALLPVPDHARAQAQDDRRLLITEGADYFGGDYDVRKDVDLQACQAACTGDVACRAFTYNSAARWCFLKNSVGELRSVGGAISGRIATTAVPAADVEADRIAELGFLPQRLLDEARRLQGAIANAPPASVPLAETIRSAEAATSVGNALGAVNLYRGALRAAPDRFDLWASLAKTALAAETDDWQRMQRLAEERSAAATNAFLRAASEQERAVALALLGRALAGRNEWMPAIRAYRASLALVETPAVREAYERAVAEHGFRVTGHDVSSDAAAPRLCVLFSEDLDFADPRLADFVSPEGGTNLAVVAERRQICVDGVEHGKRYRVVVRAGLPSSDGESLAKTVDLDIYVPDRAPSVRFSGNAYVLPAGGDASIPVVTVNASQIEARLYRIGDRQLVRALADGEFLSQLSPWQTDAIEESTGAAVWQGTVDVTTSLNREVTTAIPVDAIAAELEPGAYILTADAPRKSEEWAPKATQWFVVTDLGLTTLSGNDGLHAFVRALGSTAPLAGVTLRLVAVNNEVLGEAVSDAEGHALFAPGLMRGTGGMAPGLLTAEGPAGDYSFLDMARAPMDLTDRGVDGRAPPQPLDVFLTTERGIYRAGETVYATALVRDARADAVPGVPLTAIVRRPDGKEHDRIALADQGAGGVVAPLDLPANAMRGTWRIGIHADVKAPALAEATFLVEDFEPERLAFDLAAEGDPAAGDPLVVALDARFLYGAPASDLSVEGEAALSPVRTLAAFPGYVFGLEDEQFDVPTEPFPATVTDATGRAEIAVPLDADAGSSRPLEAIVNVRVIDPGGRPVERSLTLPLPDTQPRLGIKPLFEGAARENSTVGFDVIAVDPTGARVARDTVPWTLYDVDTNFQWYRSDGRWDYETVATRRRIASGSVEIGVDMPGRIEAGVEWGSYEIEIGGADAGILPASVSFEAGWYVKPQALETPEALKVSLDKNEYRVGETAVAHIETRAGGVAMIMVVDDRLIAMQAVEIAGTEADVPLPVTRDWGPGAYVTAFLYRPMDLEARRMPARAVGLAWAGVDPAERRLDVAIEAPDSLRPRQTMDVAVSVANARSGEEAFITLAAVDLGILNLTRYQTPAPDAYYFGQRRLGMAIRDLYGQLIDRMQGVRGVVRSGGDAAQTRFEGPPPTEALVAFHSGVVRLDAEGKATIAVPIPDFNGTVRLMAMAWTATGVGAAERDVLVRDPLVLSVSVPRFLAPGDRSRIAIDVAPADFSEGTVALTVEAGGTAVSVDAGAAARELTIEPGRRQQVLVPVGGERVGDDVVSIAATLPDGTVIAKQIALGVRINEPPVAVKSVFSLAPGASLTLGAETVAGLVPGTASLDLAASGAGALNVPAILRALDRYPYGCSEQIASRALPLVYLNEVAVAAGLRDDPEIRQRVGEAIAGVLANQAPTGGFGLWGPGSDDFWLDAYLSDFLGRAKEAGYAVPAAPFGLALDNLRNRLAYATDFESGGEDIAYSLYVLARNGRASIGDLRYYLETKLDAFATPLAKAQIGAALALYGDKARAETAFRAAVTDLAGGSDNGGWRADYGSDLRDEAAILTLASETGSEAVDLLGLAKDVEAKRSARAQTSTQEDAWSLLAAKALMERLTPPVVALDGREVSGPLFRRFSGENLGVTPVTVENRGDTAMELGVTATGVPIEPEPAGGNFYAIERQHFTLEGEPVDLAAVKQGARLVTVLTVTTTEPAGARLIVDDPLPAGFEIDNPHLLAAGDIASLDWLDLVSQPAHLEFRADRFIAALDRAESDPTRFQFAYVVRAVSPGRFAHPAALVEDMYRPERRGRSDTGRVEIVGPLR